MSVSCCVAKAGNSQLESPERAAECAVRDLRLDPSDRTAVATGSTPWEPWWSWGDTRRPLWLMPWALAAMMQRKPPGLRQQGLVVLVLVQLQRLQL